MAQDTKDKRFNTIIVKRYQNRKLYDTNQSRYVTLEDIAEMIRTGDTVSVLDNKSKRDITEATLVQIIFDAEKKTAQYAPIPILKEVIKSKPGTFSHYLSKLGVFSFPTGAQKSADATNSTNRTTPQTESIEKTNPSPNISEKISFDSEGPTNLPFSNHSNSNN